jgi:hypothetical protein
MSGEGGLEGLGHGFLSLIGFGEASDPLNNLRGEVSQARNRLQQLQNIDNYAALLQQDKIDVNLLQILQSQATTIDEHIQFYNDLALNDINKISMFTTLLSLTVIVLVFFALV